MSELADIAERIAEKAELERLRGENARLRRELDGLSAFRAGYAQHLAIQALNMQNDDMSYARAAMMQTPYAIVDDELRLI